MPRTHRFGAFWGGCDHRQGAPGAVGLTRPTPQNWGGSQRRKADASNGRESARPLLEGPHDIRTRPERTSPALTRLRPEGIVIADIDPPGLEPPRQRTPCRASTRCAQPWRSSIRPRGGSPPKAASGQSRRARNPTAQNPERPPTRPLRPSHNFGRGGGLG
jgi:hypothetical protein